LFRLDRVVGIELLDLPAEPPPAATERDLSLGLFQPSPDDVLVVLALGPGAHWVADYYPCESVEDVGDGTIIARLRTPEPGWIVRLALGLGPAARVVEPADLAAQVRSAARDALAAYIG
jgi:proteasome accessory factor C